MIPIHVSAMLHRPLVQIKKFYLRKILFFSLPINLNMCFGCSKEPSH